MEFYISYIIYIYISYIIFPLITYIEFYISSSDSSGITSPKLENFVEKTKKMMEDTMIAISVVFVLDSYSCDSFNSSVYISNFLNNWIPFTTKEIYWMITRLLHHRNSDWPYDLTNYHQINHHYSSLWTIIKANRLRSANDLQRKPTNRSAAQNIDIPGMIYLSVVLENVI